MPHASTIIQRSRLERRYEMPRQLGARWGRSRKRRNGFGFGEMIGAKKFAECQFKFYLMIFNNQIMEDCNNTLSITLFRPIWNVRRNSVIADRPFIAQTKQKNHTSIKTINSYETEKMLCNFSYRRKG